MDESLKEYPNIFKQIKDCKYPDITIEIKIILGIANM